MHHSFSIAAGSLCLGAVLATFVFPQSITAHNVGSLNTPKETATTVHTDTVPTEALVSEAPAADAEPLLQLDAPAIAALPETMPADTRETDRVRIVPFFSQFDDISQPSWRKVACGVASLAMLVEYYKPGVATADTLLAAGIAADAYTDNGWSHAGLIGLAEDLNLRGSTQSLSHLSAADAFDTLADVVTEGPVMVSVHYTFEPTNPIPHLVVVTHIADGYVHYNDPAEKRGNGFISAEKFQRAWKQRYIEIRPAT